MSKQAEHHAIAIVWVLRNPLRDDPLPRRLRGSQATATADRVAPAKGIHTLSGRPLALVLALLLVGAAISGFVVWNLKPSPPQPIAPTVISPPPAQQLAGMVAAPNVDGMSNFAVQEEFCGGMAVEGGIGKLGWFTDFGIGSSISRDSTSAPDVNHPCSLTFNSGHNIGGHAATFLMFCADSTASQDCKNYGSINVFPALGTIPFDSTFILKPTTSTNVGWAVGFFDWNNGNPCGGGNGTPTEGLCVRYRTDLDSSIIFQACRSGTCTNTASGVVPTAGDWIKIRIRSVTGGTILYSFCQSVPPNGCTLGAETSIGTNVPQNAMTPVIVTKFITGATFPQRVPQVAAASVAAVNYFSISIPVSR